MSLCAFVSSTAREVSETLQTVLIHLRPYRLYAFDAGVACTVIWVLLRLLRRRPCTTKLRGPPSEGFFYGVGRRIFDAGDASPLYDAWAQEYGPVYAVPSPMGRESIVLCDPKAIAHFFSKETWTYIHNPTSRRLLEKFFGRGLLWANGEDHKRQRKSLTPAFSIAAIRELTPVFYDSAYKVKGAWDALIESSGGESAFIDVEGWMNHTSLDVIGLVGFSHNFGALEGKHASVTEIFDTFGASPRSSALNTGFRLLCLAFPFVATWIPTPRGKLIDRLNVAMEEIANVLLAKTQKEARIGVLGGKEEKSIIGLLIKGANDDSEFHLTKEEVISQMKVLLVAGYETTAISLTWALLELSRNPDVQTKLRNELLDHGADPTYDQLLNELPYLDAVVHEVLRIHPAVDELTRIAVEDDIIPLSEPIRTKSGKLVDSLTIAEGTRIAISIGAVNISVAFWGEDAKVFRPGRWLKSANGPDGIPPRTKEIQGHRHLLTFIDGPRTCLGKNFALAEFKAVLAVLVKHFVFELRDGVDSKIEIGRGIFLRPKLAGEVGCKLPLRVRPYMA